MINGSIGYLKRGVPQKGRVNRNAYRIIARPGQSRRHGSHRNDAAYKISVGTQTAVMSQSFSVHDGSYGSGLGVQKLLARFTTALRKRPMFWRT
jgi:hypothetical protein